MPAPREGTGSEGAMSTSLTGVQLPWNQIPKFVPGVTNVQDYTRKLQFLASLWPVDYLDQLAPRAALLVEGTAFQKVARISADKLKVKSTAGVEALVSAIGGSWGNTELEDRYEHFEKALYGTVQRTDESHDSFLSRMDVSFEELISRKTTLEEVRAYVLLKQSTLPAEDKKRILLELGGKLTYAPVVKSFRLLGSKFFSEVQHGKVTAKSRVYDANVADQPDDGPGQDPGGDRAFTVGVEEPDYDIDPEFLEVMIAQDDPDALAVCSFESELEEFLQEIPAMQEAMTTYLEARTKLLEKRKNRGF